jgi:glycosyltransferase involved in cell wall biosynthesis
VNRLSLCMIVKNEEEMLPDCLRSVQGVIDELIIVDTGSTDNTVAIAEAAGAKVVHFEWCDDFAAARNVSLQQATGDFVLVLDADERLAPDAGKIIRRAMQREELFLGMLPLYNSTDAKASISDVLRTKKLAGAPMLVPRLLRVTPDLAYEGIVHEGIERWISQPGRNIVPIEARIVHLGYAEEVVESRQKRDRNIGLLYKRMEIETDSPIPTTYLASELLKIRKLDEAERIADIAWERYRPYALLEGPKPTFNNLASVRGCVKLNLGKIDEALEVFDQAQAWGADHPNVDLLQGLALEKAAQSKKDPADRRAMFIDSLRCYQSCMERHGVIYTEESLIGATSWVSWTRAGIVLTLLEQYEDAKIAFNKAISFNATYNPAQFGMAEAVAKAGDPAQALQLLQPVLTDESPDGWIIASIACEILGLVDNLPTFMSKARIQAKEDLFTTPHLRDELIRLHFATHIYCDNPVGGPGTLGILGAILHGEEVQNPLDPAEALDQKALTLLIQNLANLGRYEQIESLFTDEVERHLPGAQQVIVNALQALGLQVDLEKSREEAPEPVPV